MTKFDEYGNQIVSQEEHGILEDVYNQLNIKDPIPQYHGLKDGGHIILKCSNCRKSLLDIWIVRPKEAITEKFQALCPYCGDHSFQQEISGGVYVGGFEDKTVIDNIDEVNDVKVFRMVKR